MGVLKRSAALLLVLCFLSTAQAQPAQNTMSFSGPKRQMATIIFAGLGGAVLGLSTLSFYGRPQDHLSNIAIGFGVGVMAGTVAMTYQAATNPAHFYSGPPASRPTMEWESLRESQQQIAARTSLGSLSFSF